MYKQLALMGGILTAAVCLSGGAHAADVIKANNTDNLNLDSSWTTSPQPGTSDVAVWDDTVTAANSTVLGGALSWQGIRIANPTGTVTIGAGNSLTLGSAGIDMSAATANLNTSATTVSLGAAQTWSVGTGRTLTIRATNAGNHALTLAGPGIITIAGANLTGSGAITLGAGTTVGSALAAGSFLGTGALVINGGTMSFTNDATLSAGANTNQWNGNFTINYTGGGKRTNLNGSNLLGASNVTITTSGGGTNINGVISDGGNNRGLTKAGTQTLLLNAANTYTGNTTISSGSLVLGGTINPGGGLSSGATGSLSTSSAIVNNANLSFNRTNAVTQGVDFTGSGISGTGSLTQRGSAASTLTLNGANTYTGATSISSGTLSASTLNSVVGGTASSNLGAPVTVGAGTIGLGSTTTTGTLSYTGSGETTDRVINLAGATGGGVIDASGSAAVVFSSNFTATGAGVKTLTLQGSSTSLNAVNGAIVNNSVTNTTALNKTGVGTWVLGGTNTYTGATTVSNGTLLVNGSLAGGSAVTVASTGSLGGSGTINGTVSVSGTLTPGNSPGQLNTGSQTWLDGGDFNFQLYDASGAAGTGYDTVAITGDLNLASLTADGFDINLWTLSAISPDANGDAINFNNASNYSWTLASTTTGITGFDAANFEIFTSANNGTSGFSNDFTGGSFSVSVSGNNLLLNYTAVPEPSTYALMAMGLGALYFLRRKQRKN